jgi:hypothetical protein
LSGVNIGALIENQANSMSKPINTTLLILSSLLIVGTVFAKNNTRMIEQEYERHNNGQMIPDQQLGYYLDQENAGWSLNLIIQDIINSQGQYANNTWQPQKGWTAREIVCSSQDNRYNECASPFSGRAILTEQISDSVCIENKTWGQKAGLIWVNRGCRARFGSAPITSSNYPDNRRMIVCQSKDSKYQQCNTGFQGRVELVKKLNNSAACVSGQTWGQREGIVWVSRNCRAQFSEVAQFNHNNNYSVTCSSENNAQKSCNWDARYGQPQLQQQLSDSTCTKGRTWGYDNRNTIWVTGGCRARFTSNLSSNNPELNNNYSVTCSSENNDQKSCNWDARYGQPQLQQQLSDSTCTKGRTWGYDNRNTIWVNGGCRARFTSNLSSNNPELNNNYSVTCSSEDNAQKSCNWDARYGQPQLQQQLSDSACIKGRTWGYDNRNTIWVNGGCRARFEY